MSSWAYEAGARAQKGIEDDLSNRRDIEDRVADKPDRLHGRMEREVVLLRLPPTGRAHITPEVRAVPAMDAELDVV